MELVKVVGKLPVDYSEVDNLVAAAAHEIRVSGDKEGFYLQTLETIGNAIFKNLGDFWLIYEGSKACGYAIGSITRDIDNKLTYWGTQAYADPKIRHSPIVKEVWHSIRQYAKEHGCKHFAIISSRSTKAYLRYLGKQWHEYATILKEDI